MSDMKKLRPGFDFYLEFNGQRLLDEPLFFIIKNLREKTMSWEFFQSGGLPTYERKLRLLSEFLGVEMNPLGPLIPSEVAHLLDHFEKERKGMDRYLKYGRAPALTVDGVIFIDGKILLIRRKNDPFKGMFALPGGFVEYGEKTENAVVREIREETGLETTVKSLLSVYSDPKRDPRGHTISVIYMLEQIGGTLQEGDDADEVALFDPDEVPELAFDHGQVIEDAMRSMIS